MAMAWMVESLSDSVDKELEDLPVEVRAKFIHISELIEEFGHEQVGMPHVKHLDGPLWENAHEIITCTLRKGSAQAGYSGAGFHEENAEDTEARN